MDSLSRTEITSFQKVMHKAELDKFKDKLLGEYNVTYIDIL
jgi:hypothetical protein